MQTHMHEPGRGKTEGTDCNKLTADYNKVHRLATKCKNSFPGRDGNHMDITRPDDVEKRRTMRAVLSSREERLLDRSAEAAAPRWDQARLRSGRFGWRPGCWRGRILHLRIATAQL